MTGIKQFDIVLDDGLFLQWYNFKNAPEEGNYSRDKVYKILKYSGNNICSNFAQYKRLGLVGQCKNRALLVSLKKSPDSKKELITLAKKTNYQVILTDDSEKSEFPYINIDDNQVEMVMGGFIAKGMSREKAIKHLSSLCESARSVILYDKHFSDHKDINVETLLRIISPHAKITLCYHQEAKNPHLSQECINFFRSENVNWDIKGMGLRAHHDRYLIIDDEIEVIITSGFQYLGDTDKETAYIIRPYRSRFN